MEFKITNTDSKSNARCGILETAHGKIETPIFMPVGTVASVKAISQENLVQQVKASIILGNTYHLYLRPGTDILEQAGGLHHFMNWNRALLTDSGGYQVYSLALKRKISEKGVRFQSHIDGSYHDFTPESVIETERKIGADIMMAFDECPPWPSTKDYTQQSMQLTHRWLNRCINQFNQSDPLYGYGQSLFPIVQGGTFADLRKSSATYIASKNCDGNAIGGLSVGEPHELMYEMTELVCKILPEDKPRYLMGVGTPVNILESISLGVDMFDCVMPSRNARNGQLFTTEGIINIKNKKWAKDFSAIDAQSTVESSRNYSKAYLRHLFVAKELLALQLATQHNLAYYLSLVKNANEHIKAGDFSLWKDRIIPKLRNRL